jgi:hypothetical protein
MKMMRLLCTVLVLGLASTAAADPLHQIVLSWAPNGANWDLKADIEADEAIVGWGLDLFFSAPITASVVAYGPAWDPSGVYAANPDPTNPAVAFNFADITTYPPPNGVWGMQLLATLNLAGVVNPYTQVTVWAHDQYYSPGNVDLNEGFAANPPPSGAYVDWIIPEPSTIALLGLGLLGLLRRR